MIKFRTLATIGISYSVGYILGAKAGRPAYEHIRETLSEALGRAKSAATELEPPLVDRPGDVESSFDSVDSDLANAPSTDPRNERPDSGPHPSRGAHLLRP
jgi:hypothetical protein